MSKIRLFIVITLFPFLAFGQSEAHQMQIYDKDTASLEIYSEKGQNSDLESWISGVNFQSDFDGTKLGWSVVADGQKETFTIGSDNTSRPSLTLTSDGKFGFGTDTPGEHYELVGNTYQDLFRLRSDNEYSPGLAINSGLIASIRNRGPGDLSFKILDDEIAKINLAGWFVSEKKVVTKDRFRITDTPSRKWDLFIGASGACDANAGDLAFSRNFALKVVIDSETGDKCSVSDRRYKKDIAPIGAVKEKLLDLKTYYYNYQSQPDQDPQQIGLMAQDLLTEFPELVRYDPVLDRYSVIYDGLDVLLIKALQERQHELDDFRNRIKKLQTVLAHLKSKQAPK